MFLVEVTANHASTLVFPILIPSPQSPILFWLKPTRLANLQLTELVHQN
jgi:hypothetical protein